MTAALSTKAAALRRYAAQLSTVVGQLGRLDPPAVSRPQHETQLKTLERMRASADQLAAARLQRKNIAPLLQRFNRAATGTHSLSAQRAQAAAVRAYDADARALGTLAHQIEVERARLSNSLR